MIMNNIRDPPGNHPARDAAAQAVAGEPGPPRQRRGGLPRRHPQFWGGCRAGPQFWGGCRAGPQFWGGTPPTRD